MHRHTKRHRRGPQAVSNPNLCLLPTFPATDLLAAAGSVLFFELKHWKPKEKKFSLRGWALVAVSSLVDYSGSVPQLQTGTMKLSMLQKPVDLALSRKHKRLSPEGFDFEVNVNVA